MSSGIDQKVLHVGDVLMGQKGMPYYSANDGRLLGTFSASDAARRWTVSRLRFGGDLVGVGDPPEYGKTASICFKAADIAAMCEKVEELHVGKSFFIKHGAQEGCAALTEALDWLNTHVPHRHRVAESYSAHGVEWDTVVPQEWRLWEVLNMAAIPTEAAWFRWALVNIPVVKAGGTERFELELPKVEKPVAEKVPAPSVAQYPVGYQFGIKDLKVGDVQKDTTGPNSPGTVVFVGNRVAVVRYNEAYGEVPIPEWDRWCWAGEPSKNAVILRDGVQVWPPVVPVKVEGKHKYKVGDRITNKWSTTAWTVTGFAPLNSTFPGQYEVKDDEGHPGILLEKEAVPAPKFKVGDYLKSIKNRYPPFVVVRVEYCDLDAMYRYWHGDLYSYEATVELVPLRTKGEQVTFHGTKMVVTEDQKQGAKLVVLEWPDGSLCGSFPAENVR